MGHLVAKTTDRQPSPDAPPLVPSGTRLTRNELAGAILIQAALAVLFLSPALFTGRTFSPSDLLFNLAPWSDQPPAGWTQAGNPAQFDSTFVFEPWLHYTAEALHAGRLPLWNPDNYLGAPFFGNIQSAIFYPGNWLYYLWPSGDLYAVRAWLELLVAAAGMYLLARESLHAGRIAAHLAAITFTYSGFLIIWLFWPLTSVAIWLPWLWWATDRLMARPSARWVAGLAGLVVVTIFAGHPETTFHVALFTGAFALFRAWRAAPTQPIRIARLLGLWTLGYALGGALAAVQLLPFAEYMAQSMVLVWRNNPDRPHPWTPLAFLWTIISPNLFGNPAHHTEWEVPSSYIDNNIYCGLLALILAPLALWSRERAQRASALLLLGLIVLIAGAVYRLPGLYDLVSALPGLDLASNRRLVLFFPFALGLLAALGFEALRRQGGSRRVLLTGGAALLGVLGGGIVLPWLGAHSLFNLPALPGPAATWQAALLRAAGVLGLSAALLGLAGLAIRRGPGWGGRAIWLAFPLLLFADLWQARVDYNPTIAPADHFPPTRVSQVVQQQPPPARFTGIGSIFPPNTSLWYDIPDLRGYDALEPQSYRDMVIEIDPVMLHRPGGAVVVLKTVRSPMTNLLGVRTVATDFLNNPNYAVIAQQETPGLAVGELVPGRLVGQSFVAPADRLAGIQLLTANYARPTQGRLRFHLKTDPAAATDLASGAVDAQDWPNNQFWPIYFPPVADSAGRTFYFALEAVDTQPGSAPTLWASPQDVYPAGTRWEQGQPVAGDLAFRLLSLPEPPGSWFALVSDGGPHATSVYENRRAFPRAWLTHRVEVEPDPAARPPRLADPAFDARATALLAAPLPPDQPLPAVPPPQAHDTVTLTHYAAETVEIATRSPAAGVLVLADQAFPGWAATVDGAPTPLVTTDHALRGVYVPAGSHTVRFSYEPLSFRLGAGISGIALVILAGLLVGWPIGRRKTTGGRVPAHP
jgi:hypothetical protein